MPDDGVLTDPSRIVAQGSVADTSVADQTDVLSPKSRKKQDKKAKPKVTTLFIYDKTMNENAIAIQKSFYEKAKTVAIETWGDLQSTLSRYSEIGTLVIYTHSTPGNLVIGGRSPPESQQGEQLGKTGVTVTKEIFFEGCSIMGRPKKVAELVSNIAAPSASAKGYTLFVVVQEIKITLTGDEDQEEIEEARKPWVDEYLLPKPTVAELVGEKGNKSFFRRWFRKEYDTTPPEQAEDARHIKSYGELGRRTINTQEEAEALNNEMQSPFPPGEIVTVNNIHKLGK